MPTRRIYLAKYRGSATQRAHFAIFIPNANHDRSTVDQDFRGTPTLGTIIHVVGEPTHGINPIRICRCKLYVRPMKSDFVKESIARSRLEHEAMAVTPPPRGQNLSAPIDGVTTKRCQEWTMEYLQRLVSRSLLTQDAVGIAQSQRDPPTLGVFGAAKAAPQPLPNQPATPVRATAGSGSGEWVWDTEHKRYRRWDGAKWIWR